MKNTVMLEQKDQVNQEEHSQLKRPKKEDSQSNKCLLCTAEFKTSRNNLKKFCCMQHKRQYRRNLFSKKTICCLQCNKDFISSRQNQVFCSKSCAGLNADNFRYKNDTNYRLARIIRSRLYSAMNQKFKYGTIKYLGCSIEEFRVYLESKFEPWMTWGNYGKYNKNKDTWQIDHIRPLDGFNLSDEKELIDACSYINMQPLKAIDNIKKSNK